MSGSKKALTGALTYEILGEEKERKADDLANSLREKLADRTDVRVSRPFKAAEIRITGIDIAADPEEIRGALASEGNCPASEITLEGLKPTPRNGNSVWARSPLVAVNKIVAKGGIKIGWTKARVEVLENRPLQCHRCHLVGHVMAQCKGVDRHRKLGPGRLPPEWGSSPGLKGRRRSRRNRSLPLPQLSKAPIRR